MGDGMWARRRPLIKGDTSGDISVEFDVENAIASGL